uniref:Natterin-2 n=1 Tax=Thalassophryne nattereri TaxID=289382 RepID=NATT2_THANI|nr:RecName: Full=Natterin-2; Flags: Precursor [Thalassophryne nattereri]AAU11823.1 natterin 2 precursor [Thalassophryne nattereri]
MNLSVLLVTLLLLSWTSAEKDLKVRVARSTNDETNLHWVKCGGSVPDGAVSIRNTYVSPARTEYVCKCFCQAGYYSTKDSKCHYPYGTKEMATSTNCYILVNRDNFELLEWKDGYAGSVPDNAVSTCKTNKIYVGKGAYGLGKIEPANHCLYYVWDGAETWTKTYQALTMNKDVIEQAMKDVKYQTEGVTVIKGKPEVMRRSTVNNQHCKEVTKTVTLTKDISTDERWDVTNSVTFGVTTTVTAGIPDVSSASLEISMQATMDFAHGASKTETQSYMVTVSVPVPPKQSCTVSMVAQVNKADIPFTATLIRTYRGGKKTQTTTKGVYRTIQVAETHADVEQCTIIGDAKDCPNASSTITTLRPKLKSKKPAKPAGK